MKTTTLLLLILLSQMIAKAQDLRADVNQSTFTKVINSICLPMTIFEYRDDFKRIVPNTDEPTFFADSLTTTSLTAEKSRALYKAAVEDRTPVREEDAVVEDSLRMEWERVIQEINQIVQDHDRKRPDDVPEVSVEGYTIEELRKIKGATVEETIRFFEAKERGAFALKAHLAFFRLNLNEKPALQVASPSFGMGNIKVEPTVTGELWTKIPEFRCCRTVLGICVCVRVSWKWKRIASLTVSPNIGADAEVKFSESQLKIVAKASFRRLYLDYAILRELNLAAIANYALRDKSFEVYDASQFVASLPYINSKFHIESISLPAKPDGVTIQLNVK